MVACNASILAIIIASNAEPIAGAPCSIAEANATTPSPMLFINDGIKEIIPLKAVTNTAAPAAPETAKVANPVETASIPAPTPTAAIPNIPNAAATVSKVVPKGAKTAAVAPKAARTTIKEPIPNASACHLVCPSTSIGMIKIVNAVAKAIKLAPAPVAFPNVFCATPNAIRTVDIPVKATPMLTSPFASSPRFIPPNNLIGIISTESEVAIPSIEVAIPLNCTFPRSRNDTVNPAIRVPTLTSPFVRFPVSIFPNNATDAYKASMAVAIAKIVP